MRGVLSGGLLAALVVLGTFPANAQEVERSGGVYHKAVCGFVAGPAARCHAHVVTDRAGRPLASPQPPIGGLAPADLRDAYKITALGSPATIVAIVDAFGYTRAEADLAVYRAQFGLPACTTANGCFKKLNQKGQQKKYPPQDIGWAQESALDLDMASTMCPGCTIYLVEAKNNSFKNLAAAVDEAAKLGAHVVSNSYGGPESKAVKKFEPSYDHVGVAVTASTGDNSYSAGPQFPATSPHVTAVGGTRLVKDGSARGWAETAWTSAGSGCSKIFAKPAWQTDPGCKRRTDADVAAVADPASGVAVYGPNNQGASTWLIFGGTSVAAPLIGGVYGANGGAVTYGSDPYAHVSALFDITSGANGSCKPPYLYLCNAGVGYDGPTGLGTPNGIAAFGAQ